MIDNEMLASVEDGMDWGDVAKGAAYGAGIRVGLCAAGGIFTGGATWLMTADCAWAGAKLGGSFVAIANSIN